MQIQLISKQIVSRGNIILMSLLTSPSTTKQQLKFLNKMEKYYHKRGASQYIPKEKSDRNEQPLFTTKVSTHAVDKVKNLISQFMADVENIIKEFTMLDHYGVLEILRKHEFFSDVAVAINGGLYNRIETLERELVEKEEKIYRLKKERQQKLETSEGDKLEKIESFSNKNNIRYNPAKSAAANIYCHAKAMDQEDFIAYYNKISLSNPITLKKVQPDGKKENVGLLAKVNELLTYSKNNSDEQKVQEIIHAIKQVQKEQSQPCKNPCCQVKFDSPDTRLNKAKTLINTTQIKPSKNVYKNDKSEQYFRRYYRGSGFNIQDVTSVERTKMEEMQKIENEYNKNLKARKKYQAHHRYSCSFSGH